MPVCDKTPRHVKRQIPIFSLDPPATLTTTAIAPAVASVAAAVVEVVVVVTD